jgi:hypothetical protein
MIHVRVDESLYARLHEIAFKIGSARRDYRLGVATVVEEILQAIAARPELLEEFFTDNTGAMIIPGLREDNDVPPKRARTR